MFGKSISSNETSVAIAEELTAKTLPPQPVWYELEPNEYSDFGSEITTVARETINQGRQRKRGTLTDLDAQAGFTQDLTKTNLPFLAQGFMFSNLRQKVSTEPLGGAKIAITGVNGAGAYSAASGLAAFPVGSLVYTSDFGTPGNNGVGKVTASTATTLTTSRITTAEPAPPLAAKIELVGIEFASGDVTLTVGGGIATLTVAAGTFAPFNLNPGEWIFIGDAVASSFGSGNGYARIKSVSAKALVFDKISWTATADAGSGKTIRVYFGNFLRNENLAANIKYHSYQIERTLGRDGDGVQSQYITGAVANELTIAIPTADKITTEFAFVGMDEETRTGLQGVKTGTRIPARGEEAINSTNDVYRSQMTLLDPTTLQPNSFFAYVTELNISINNNVSPVKVIGNLGSIDMTAGQFEVGGEATAIFATVEAMRAVRRNSDVTYDVIIASQNAGVIFDIPLMGVGGGMPEVGRDDPITIALENMAAENPLGYTLGMMFFPYLPNIAMGTDA